MGFESLHADTTHGEMRRILATDLGITPEEIAGYVIVIALKHDAHTMQPTVRSDLSSTTAAYLLAGAQADLLYMTLSNPDHPDHGDVCDAPPDKH